MDWIITAQIVCLIGLAFCIFFLWRNAKVKEFVDQYLAEEDIFVSVRVIEGKGFDTFRRHNSLPDYYTMVFCFWIPLSKYRKPLSDFYKD